MTFLAPLEGARLDANARRTLIAVRRENVVGAPNELGGRVEAIANHTNGRVGCDAASFRGFAVSRKEI